MPHGRPEFVLETSQEPHAFVIRKQVRTSAIPHDRPMVLAYYYIANNKIMQSPSIHQVTHARLQRCTYALQAGFARLQADLEPLTRQATQLEKQSEREAKRQRTADGPGAEGAGPTAAAGAAALAPSTRALPTAGAAALAPSTGALPPAVPQQGAGQGHGAAATAGPPDTAAAASIPPYDGGGGTTLHPYGPTVDLESPSLGTLRAPLSAPLPEVMAAAAAAPPAAAGSGVPVRRHLTDADRARWNKLDRILSHQFSSLQRIKYTALPPDYLQRLHSQMYGMQPQTAPPPPAAAAPTPTPAAQ
ncbi:hypothetical protein GPECTOR_48g443 [Gonium pectorale]|uniref:Mediator of RNA polymerase II transcription subunit 6 n=1 Tax=Gonium pectorale TaxID=33097 RepID=A0A150G876_GONPE|nr:hypothetical protein GPECTOR_48g443 [Gonium pectorale]|eukprot:KXZ46011.1 hypothetical protein GPECTOR_48g443 [Gonium pectorale]